MKKYEMIVNDLISKINTGIFTVGSPLPSESKIISMYGVSRITAQKALNILVQKNLAERFQGRGTFVKHIPASPSGRFVSIIIPNTIYNSLKIMEGAEMVISQAGMHLSVTVVVNDAAFETDSINRAISSNAAGIILYLTNENPSQQIINLIHSGYPIVFIDKAPRNIPCTCVCPDNFFGALSLTDFIVSKGHTKIGFLGAGTDMFESVTQRYAGFCESMKKNNININNDWIINDFDQSLIKKLLMSDIRPTALFCCNDNCALLLHKFAAQLDIQIPDSLSIACFDGGELTMHLTPSICAAIQPFSKIGSTAAELLLNKLKNENPTENIHNKIYLPVQIREGNSVLEINRKIKASQRIY